MTTISATGSSSVLIVVINLMVEIVPHDTDTGTGNDTVTNCNRPDHGRLLLRARRIIEE